MQENPWLPEEDDDMKWTMDNSMRAYRKFKKRFDEEDKKAIEEAIKKQVPGSILKQFGIKNIDDVIIQIIRKK